MSIALRPAPVAASVARLLEIRAFARAAEDVAVLELVDPQGAPLAPFAAGAHIDLSLANGLKRSYSLVNDPRETSRYVIAVARERSGRGGSAFIHHALQRGDRVFVALPRNNFALVEDAAHTVLIAGGIGVTPLRAMIHRLEALGASWEMLYAARSRRRAVFYDELLAHEGRVRFHFDDESGGAPDLASLFAAPPPGTHFYACGPEPMLRAFEALGAARPAGTIHLERFAGAASPVASGGFEVVLARSGRALAIPPGATILDALLDEGVDVDFSCMEGFCGTCKTRVLGGVPDHRDAVLTPAERDARNVMMICCSGSKGPRLTLDL